MLDHLVVRSFSGSCPSHVSGFTGCPALQKMQYAGIRIDACSREDWTGSEMRCRCRRSQRTGLNLDSQTYLNQIISSKLRYRSIAEDAERLDHPPVTRAN
ncbi:hypothetical protein HZ326_16729 [Fusarium oxysporum f. sp. albedinis]|nr:hypothetical protein HZ326_16729 [Fusarium oxysporum f. sp. albedinis]